MSGFEVRNLVSGTTVLVPSWPVSAVSLSADGRFVAFSSWSPGSRANVFVRDLATGVTTLVSVGWNGGPANGNSGTPAISASGRYVAFESDASNLVRGDRNWFRDVFVRDLVTGKTSRVSVTTRGAGGWDPGTGAGLMDDNNVAISADGRFVAFTSDLQDLVRGDANYSSDVFVCDRRSGVTSLISVTRAGGVAAGLYGRTMSVQGVVTRGSIQNRIVGACEPE
jgi:Tol biopolymer transport system component